MAVVTTTLAIVADTSFDRVTLPAQGRAAPSSSGILRCGPSSKVLAVDTVAQRVYLVERPELGAMGAAVRGVPGRTSMYHGDDPLTTAKQALGLELGLEAARWELVAAAALSSPARSDELTWLWLAWDLGPAPRQRDAAETTSIALSFSQLEDELTRFRRVDLDQPRRDLAALPLLMELRFRLLAGLPPATSTPA